MRPFMLQVVLFLAVLVSESVEGEGVEEESGEVVEGGECWMRGIYARTSMGENQNWAWEQMTIRVCNEPTA